MLQRKRCKITGIGGTIKSTEVGDISISHKSDASSTNKLDNFLLNGVKQTLYFFNYYFLIIINELHENQTLYFKFVFQF